MKTLHLLISAIIISLICVSCQKESGKIVLDVYLLVEDSQSKSAREIPESGMTITIDTIAKNIHIPLKGIVGDDFMLSQISKEYLPYYDSIKQEINYTILSWEHKDKTSILFNVSCNDQQFRCAIIDSTFSIKLNDRESIGFMGGSLAKESNKNMNEAKKQVYKSLIGM